MEPPRGGVEGHQGGEDVDGAGGQDLGETRRARRFARTGPWPDPSAPIGAPTGAEPRSAPFAFYASTTSRNARHDRPLHLDHAQWPQRVPIALEELGLEYTVHPVDIGQNQQFAPDFLRISPNNKIPAIVDHDAPDGPQSVFESGAILVYLAEKTGKLLAASGPDRVAALEWTFWQVGGLGPMAGQLGCSRVRAPEPIELAIDTASPTRCSGCWA